MSPRFRMSMPGPRYRLCALDRDVFVRPGVGEILDQIEPGHADPGSDAVDESQLPDRRERPTCRAPAAAFSEDRSPSLMVEFRGLLRTQRVDVGIAAIDVGPAFDDEGVEAGGGIAERTAAALDEVLVRPCRPNPSETRRARSDAG